MHLQATIAADETKSVATRMGCTILPSQEVMKKRIFIVATTEGNGIITVIIAPSLCHAEFHLLMIAEYPNFGA